MVDIKTGVVYEAPVFISVPATGASYQSYVPPGAVAVNVAVLPLQIPTDAIVGAAGIGFTVTVTAVRGPAHPPEDD